jgi:hypothetical protein
METFIAVPLPTNPEPGLLAEASDVFANPVRAIASGEARVRVGGDEV